MRGRWVGAGFVALSVFGFFESESSSGQDTDNTDSSHSWQKTPKIREIVIGVSYCTLLYLVLF